MGIARFCFPYGNRTTSTKSRFPYGNQGIQGNRAIPIWESTVDALGIVAENLQNVLFTRSEGQTMLSIVKCYCFVRLSDVSQSRRFHDRDSFRGRPRKGVNHEHQLEVPTAHRQFIARFPTYLWFLTVTDSCEVSKTTAECAEKSVFTSYTVDVLSQREIL